MRASGRPIALKGFAFLPLDDPQRDRRNMSRLIIASQATYRLAGRDFGLKPAGEWT